MVPAFLTLSMTYFAWLTATVRLRFAALRMWQFMKIIRSPESAKTSIPAAKSNSVKVSPLRDDLFIFIFFAATRFIGSNYIPYWAL